MPIGAATIRSLVVAEILVMVASIAAAMLERLPPELERWNQARDIGLEDAVSIPLFLGMVVGYVGVLQLRAWGRAVYTGVAFAGLFAMLIDDAGVYTRWTGFLSDLAQAITWTLVALMHFSPARALFDGDARGRDPR